MPSAVYGFFLLIFPLFYVVSLPQINRDYRDHKSYYPSLNERIESLKHKYKNGKLEDNHTFVDFSDPDCNRSALDIITNKSYAGEVHHVTTFDKYILGIQRIPAPQFQKPDGSKKPVVLVWHGLQGCSVNWITNNANNSLAFMLADAGYDVWLGNSRGNTYSTDHERLSPSNARFWKFSWDHMAAYDLPATIDYILNVTGQEQLYYVGHSQGTLIGFAQFSSDLNFAQKVKAFFALAPVAHIGNVEGFIKQIAPFVNKIDFFLEVFGYNDFLPYDGDVHKIERKECNDGTIDQKVCDAISSAVVGDAALLNQSRIGVIMAHCPAGTSTQNMAHYGQMVDSDLMQAFDYAVLNDTERNERHYGQDTPPVYDVSKLNVPTMTFHSDSDHTADPTDVAWLLGQINNTLIQDYHYTDYAHTDFIWAPRAAYDVYPHIISYIQQQELTTKKR